MKHFSDDGCNPQPDYDTPTIRLYNSEEDGYDRDKTIGTHYEPDPEDWYEGFHHFEDE